MHAQSASSPTDLAQTPAAGTSYPRYPTYPQGESALFDSGVVRASIRGQKRSDGDVGQPRYGTSRARTEA
jgi:hypothetical protein